MLGHGGFVENRNYQIIPDVDEEGEAKVLLLLLTMFRNHFLLLFNMLPKFHYENSQQEHINPEKKGPSSLFQFVCFITNSQYFNFSLSF